MRFCRRFPPPKLLNPLPPLPTQSVYVTRHHVMYSLHYQHCLPYPETAGRRRKRVGVSPISYVISRIIRHDTVLITPLPPLPPSTWDTLSELSGEGVRCVTRDALIRLTRSTAVLWKRGRKSPHTSNSPHVLRTAASPKLDYIFL